LEFDDSTLLYSIVHDIYERVKIENALRASEEKYRNIFETVQDAYYEASPEGIILNISPAIENISKGQFTRDDLIGKPFVLFYSDPDVKNTFYINLMIHGRVNDYELTLLNKDGSVVPVAITSTLVFDIEGNPLKIIGSIRDISERKIVEEMVRTSEDKYRRDLVLLNSIFESPIDIIVFSLDTNYCYTAFTKYHVDIMKAIWGMDIQSGMNMLDLISNPDDRQKAKSNFDRAFMGEHFVLIEEYGDDVLLRTYYDNYYSSVRNGDGEIIGVSVFVIDATERTQAVLKLAQSEDRFSQVVAQSQEVVWEVDTEGLYTYVSPMAKDVYGYAPEELVGKLHFYDIFPEKEREQVKEAAFEIFSRKRDIRSFVNKVVKPDSSEIILLTNGIPIVDTHNNLVGYRGIDANVTEQKRAEENLLKVDRLRSVISNINHAIIFERSKEKLLEKVCNIAIVSGKFQMAWIGLVNEETQKVEPYKVDGFDNGYLSQVTPISVLDSLELRGPTVAAIHEGNPFICNDIENDPRMALWKDEALKRNYRSNITIPIKQFGEILGVLSLYSTQPNLFNSDEVELLVAVVDNISNALLAIETENERSLAEAELRKLSRAVEQCPVSIIITDIEGNIEYANPKACKTTGYTFNELIGQNPRIFKSGEISKDNYLSLWETISTGKEWYGTFHNKMKTGELYWESATIAPVTDEQGTITHYVGIKEDITQRKKSEEENRDLNENLELRIRERTQQLDEMNSDLHQEIEERKRLDEALTASEQSYKTVVENINEIIFQTDVKGLWLFLNKSWEEVTGFTVNESLGQLFVNYVHPDDKQLNLDLFASLINRDKDYFRHEIRYLTKDGGFRWIELFARLGINENDEIIGTYGTLQDITERKIADDEIRKARLEAEQANTAKSEFLSRMSHELRTPMNSILGFAQILEMGELDLGQKMGVSHILNSGKHLLSLINEVLDISRIEAGHLSMSVEPIKINNILEEMLEVMRPLAFERQIDLTLVPSSDNQLFVNFDRQSLKQVMLNLLSNAIKYNKPLGSVVVKTQLIPPTDEGKAFIRISIVDTGVGLSAVDIPKIFTPFERVGADKTGIEGAGLGLAVVKKIIDVMGGFISVESSLGKGSTFLIDLPRAEIQLNNLQKLELLSDANSKYVKRRRTVLYIEDNASNIELVKQILLIQRPDIQLISDGNGTQAVRLATEYKPDLILLDLNLPDIHGSEVIKLLLADKKTKNIPVVVISADAMHLQVEKLIEAGAKTYLTKPLVVVDFSKVIDEYIYN
jgi:PAS domain S-box-containing protein